MNQKHLAGPLRNAANNGELDRVRELLRAGAPPDIPNKKGQTALQLAVEGRRYKLVPTLIAAGADPFRRVNPWMSPIATAAVRTEAEVLRALLASDQTQPRPGDLEDALAWAVIGASIECIDILLERGADFRARNEKGHDAIDRARWWRDEAHADNKPKFQRVIDHLRTLT